MALAIKAKGLAKEVICISHRPKTIRTGLKLKVIDSGSMDISQVRYGDLIIICTPISLIIPKITAMLPYLRKETIVTDVGSIKGEIVEKAEKILRPKKVLFVGGHPMAGKEKIGVENAETSLFKGKTYIFTKTRKTDQKALQKLKRFAKELGVGKILEFSPETHDLIVAAISHLPLLAAVAMVRTIIKQKKLQKEMVTCLSTGFLDTTRIASGDPVMGKDILVGNKKNLTLFKKLFLKNIAELNRLLGKKNTNALLKELGAVKKFRDEIVKRKGS